MHNHYTTSILTNCVFSRNSARNTGGGIYNADSSLTLNNCAFSRNLSGENGGGLYNNVYSSTILTNCILWNDSPDEILNGENNALTVTYSNIQGSYEGEGNIDVEPLFLDPENDDLHLTTGSPCIDAGNNDASLSATDFEGDDRILDGDNNGSEIVDMGVDEFVFLEQ